MEKYTMFMDWKNQYIENEYTTQSNLQIQCNPCQVTNGIFQRTRTNNFTVCMEIQKTRIAKATLRKKGRQVPLSMEFSRQEYCSGLSFPPPEDLPNPGIEPESPALAGRFFSFHFSLSCIGEGNGNPLQCSCLEDPKDGGAWWAAVYGVAQSWTRLK